jgi:hypothetical protein
MNRSESCLALSSVNSVSIVAKFCYFRFSPLYLGTSMEELITNLQSVKIIFALYIKCKAKSLKSRKGLKEKIINQPLLKDLPHKS